MFKIGDDDAFAQVELGHKSQLYHLTQLSGSWGDVLPSQIYYRAMGHLVDAVLGNFVHSVQKLDDIPEAVAHQLHYLLSLLFESSRVFAASTVDRNQESKQTEVKDVKPESYCRHWVKAQAVAVLLVCLLLNLCLGSNMFNYVQPA